MYLLFTYRPRKVEMKPDGIGEARKSHVRTKIDDILAEYRRHNVTVSARCRCVDLSLILFQANPESGFTNTGTLARTWRTTRATIAKAVLAVLVHEWLQPQLKYPRGRYL